MLHVSLTPSFVVALEDLDSVDRQHVLDTLPKIVRGLPSTGEHRLEAAPGFLSFKVNRHAMRIIAVRRGQTLHLLHVDEHDAAIRWARTHRVGPIANDAPVDIEEAAPEPVAGPDASEAVEIEPPGPLAHLSRSKFARLGLPDPWARATRTIDDDQLHSLGSVLRPHVHDAMYALAMGEPFEPVMRRFDDAAAEENPARAWPGSTTSQIREAMRRGDWSVHLHASQLALVRKDARGPMKVTGGPGTGKTVVAVHRAWYLAEELLNDDIAPILLTSPIPHMAGPLRAMVAQLAAHRPDVAERIEVHDLREVARAQVAPGPDPRVPATAQQIASSWADAAGSSALDWGTAEYDQERIDVLDRNGVWTWEDYRDVPREGRGIALGSRQRAAVWKVLDAFEKGMAAAGVADSIAMARLAEEEIRMGRGARRYSAVVCDEVQDCTGSELRLLAALASEMGGRTVRPNGLTIVGDGFQRLHASPLVLSRSGIEVRGRSHRLNVSYRTTEGIRRAAVEQVATIPPDPLDRTAEEGEDSPLDGFRSLLAGRPPLRRWFATEAEEVAFLRDQWLDGEGGLLVLTRTEADRDRLAAELHGLADGTEPVVLDENTAAAPDRHGLTLCTIARATGLEAPRVAIAGAQHLRAFVDGPQRASAHECRLAYTAMTRGRDWLSITGVGTPPDA